MKVKELRELLNTLSDCDDFEIVLATSMYEIEDQKEYELVNEIDDIGYSSKKIYFTIIEK